MLTIAPSGVVRRRPVVPVVQRSCIGSGMVHPAETDDLDDAVDQLRAAYDATPYTSVSFPPSAPGQLAAVAHLFGLETAGGTTASLLENRWGTGGNLIPF